MAGLNFTPFPCSEAFLRNAAGELRRVLVLRQTFVGSTGALTNVQEPVELVDRYTDRGAMVAAADMVVERTGTTVLVRGKVVSAESGALQVPANIRVGAIEHRLVAFPGAIGHGPAQVLRFAWKGRASQSRPASRMHLEATASSRTRSEWGSSTLPAAKLRRALRCR